MIGHVKTPKRHYLPTSFQNAGKRTTVAFLLEQKQKLEIGERIRWLRENTAETNRSIADYCDVSVESPRNWIAGKGIKWDNAEKVAELFKVDVGWIWRGEGEVPEGYPQEEKPPAPDLMTTLSAADSERIERIEEKLDEILKRLPAEVTEGDEGLDDAEREAEQTSQDDQRSAQDADQSLNRDQARQPESEGG